MLSLNREYTLEEYDECHAIVKECVKHLDVPYDPDNADSFRQLMTLMLPLLMMRHRRIARHRWRDFQTPTGKHWIEQEAPDGIAPEKYLNSMIGYHLTFENGLCAMAMTQGSQRKVINIGMGLKQLCVEPPGVTASAYAESFAHKLTPLEMSFLSGDLTDEHKIRRLCIMLALKSAYIKAIGQPIGFDWSRIEFNLPEKTAKGDDHPLTGWEFRIFKAHIGVARRDQLVEEQYQCVVAFFRGGEESNFIWYDNQKELETWVQFIYIDQMVKVAPKLLA